MLEHLHLRLEGRHHSGIDDCRNITAIAKKMLQDGFVFSLTTSGGGGSATGKPPNAPPAWVSVGKGKICLTPQPNRKYLSEWKTEQGLTNVVLAMTNADGAASFQKTYNDLGLGWIRMSLPKDEIPLPTKNNDYAKGTTAEPLPGSMNVLTRSLLDLEAASRLLANGAGLLIHCDSGTKRTAMVAYVILRCQGKTKEETLAIMKQTREATVQYLDANREAWAEQMIKHLNLDLACK